MRLARTYDAIMEAPADMIARALLQEGGGNSEAGKAIVRASTAAARTQMERIQQAKVLKQLLFHGATDGK